MRRAFWISAAGVVLLASGYFGFLPLFRYLDARANRKPEMRRLTLHDVGRPPSSSSAPGLAFIREFDEIRFLYLRSFDPQIEIIVRRPSLKKDKPPLLRASVVQQRMPEGQGISTSEKEISEKVYRELTAYVLREDLIERSLVEREGGADGSTWILEGRKGQFIVRHVRWCPPYYGDKTFVAIGKRFLELAEIKIPDEKFY